MSLHNQQAVRSNSLITPTNRLIIRRYSKDQKAEIYSVHSDSDEFNEEESIRIENPFRGLTRFYYRIVGSSNGVLCLSDDLFGHTHSIFLWNLVIRRKVTLPPPRATFESTWPCMCVLGFRYDVKNDDYKVVRVAYAQVECGYSVPPEVEVYSLSAGNWRGISGNFRGVGWLIIFGRRHLLVNENVHWVAYRGEAWPAEVGNLIIVFDLSNEVFDEMPVLDALTTVAPFNLNMAVLEQSLAIYQYDMRGLSKSCSIWVMRKYGDTESWSKQFYVDLEEGIGTILGVRRNRDVLLTASNGGLIAHNQDTETRMELGIAGMKDSFYSCSHVGRVKKPKKSNSAKMVV